MRKTEDHHHSPPQVALYLAQALSILDEEGLGEPERSAVLPVLVQLLSSKQLFYEQPQALPVMAIPRNQGRH